MDRWPPGTRADAAAKRPLRVGVVGCGVIAQVMHLHYLRELGDRFAVTEVCDLSPASRRFAATMFPGAREHEDWHGLVQAPLDAVLVLTSGSHAPVAIAAASSGLDVFVEKPLAFSVAEGRAVAAAAQQSGVVVMVGYMKRYDPTFAALGRELDEIDKLLRVQVTTLEAPNDPYIEHYPIASREDVDPARLQAVRDDERTRIASVIGQAASDPSLYRVYRYVLLDVLVHEFNALRALLGDPTAVEFVRVNRAATSLTVLLTFDETDCVITWTEQMGIVRYRQEFSFFGSNRSATLTFPSSMLRSMPARLSVEGGTSASAGSWRAEHLVSYESSFKRELIAFHAATQTRAGPITSVADALGDLALCEAAFRALTLRTPIPNPCGVPLAGHEPAGAQDGRTSGALSAG
jgi:predicted dehydrogenase